MECTLSPTASEPLSSGPEKTGKRRKVRKGTSSCWECKRRKVKCTFASPEAAVCLNCRRRKSTCVSQDLPEESSTCQKADMGHRIGRDEVVVNNLIKRIGGRVNTPLDEPASTPSHGSISSRLSAAGASEPAPTVLARSPSDVCSNPRPP